MYRRPVNKHVAAKKFRHAVGKTKSANLPRIPMRGGWRL